MIWDLTGNASSPRHVPLASLTHQLMSVVTWKIAEVSLKGLDPSAGYRLWSCSSFSDDWHSCVGFPPPGSLHMSSLSRGIAWTSSQHGSWFSGNESRSCHLSQRQVPELVQHHFCYISLIKANHRPAQVLGEEKQTLFLCRNLCREAREDLLAAVFRENLPQRMCSGDMYSAETMERRFSLQPHSEQALSKMPILIHRGSLGCPGK